MKLVLLLPLILAFAGAALGDEKDTASSPDQEQLKQSAMMLLEDVVPHAPVSDAMVKVSSEGGHAIWGKIFGDDQIGALVAVKSDKAKTDDDADLCLLLWDDGWKFVQWAGKIPKFEAPVTSGSLDPQDWNWALKRRVPGDPYYVVSGLDLNTLSYQKHPSWLCDPKTHSLPSTGWPTDAMPSLSGQTITFRRCAKSGYAPFVFEIDEFDGKPGKNLVTYTDDYGGGGRPSLLTVTMPDPVTGKRVTWRIAPSTAKYEAGHDKRLLCYSPIEGTLEPFHEDAAVDVQWGTQSYPNSATNFLIWRLTGIERNAQMGIWDEDIVNESEQWKNTVNLKPAQTVVTGIPAAVKAFSWPLSPSPQVPDVDKPR
jgi:hypothetical protein